ncbi:Alpha/Beta hydrolase protein [Cantharellus anzutake]|uniref:Alpha/Beta hydrolase protein n=1 Tax=Cantharellus anzutake TaxID=1750568 RepID=UPI001907423E|nr:Alpha/Beta hydrolase protein [Cantharellus anzutake]KAF8342953.1 Alpha/Beta hydrolase protein [Cantharellus anzutake]
MRTCSHSLGHATEINAMRWLAHNSVVLRSQKTNNQPSWYACTSRMDCGPPATAFYTQLWTSASGESRAHLIYVHGFGEHVGRYEDIFPLWVNNGVSVFAYDQRGFGRTALDEEHKSATSSWCRSCWKDQVEDLEFFIGYESTRVGHNLPIFLMGFSMGGTEVLGIVATPPLRHHVVNRISGVIAEGPMLLVANPDAWEEEPREPGDPSDDTPEDPYEVVPIPLRDAGKWQSRNPTIIEAFKTDPLLHNYTTRQLRNDTLSSGSALAKENFKNWPKNLPLLIVHGDGDLINSCKASQDFVRDTEAADATCSPYPGAYHELHHEPDGQGLQAVNECIKWMIDHIPGRS